MIHMNDAQVVIIVIIVLSLHEGHIGSPSSL